MILDIHTHIFPRSFRDNRQVYFANEPAFELLYQSPKARLVGVEDLVFSFATGGLAWLLATPPSGRPVVIEVRPWRSLTRYGACSSVGLSVALGAWWLGMGIMPAFWLSMVVVGGCLLVWRPSMWRLSLTGALWFVGLYAAATVTVFSAFPRLGLHFTQTNLLGITVLGVPVEELVWALGYGAVYPLVLAYSFEAVVSGSPARVQRASAQSPLWAPDRDHHAGPHAPDRPGGSKWDSG